MKRTVIGVAGLRFGGALIRRELVDGSGSPFFKLKTVCDTDRDRADGIASRFGTEVCYDLGDLLNDGSLEAIGLFTNPNGRAELVRRIIRSGKHVITTKPFELDPVEAEKVLKEAESLGRRVLLNSPPPVVPDDVLYMKRLIAEHQFGMAVGCRADSWVSYRDRGYETDRWLVNAELCPVAPMTRHGIYLINAILDFFEQPQEVQVLTSVTGTTQCDLPDNAQGTIRFRSGALASIFTSLAIDDGIKSHSSMVLNFERGTIRWSISPDGEIRVTALRGGNNPGNISEKRIGTGEGGYRWDVFHRMIRGKAIDNVVATQRIIDGVKILAGFARSERSGRTETIV